MKQTKKSRVQKVVTFSPQLYFCADTKAKQLGVPFAEYLRHLVLKDVEKEAEEIYMVDEETERRIGESFKALNEGRYFDVDPSNEEEMKKLVGLK